MATRAILGLLLPLALASASLPVPAEPARSPLVLDPTFVDRNLRLTIRGAADLPNGVLLSVNGRRLEAGKPVVAGAWQLFAEVKEKAFEVERIGARTSFRPGRYTIEVSLAANQRQHIAGLITDAHRRFRLAGTVDLGGDLTLHGGAVELARPIVTGFREAVTAPAQAAAAAARLDKALARKELPYYLPSATLFLPLLGRIRQAASPPAPGAPPAAPADPAAPAPPSNDEVTRLLRPVFLDGLEMFVVAIGDLSDSYTMIEDNRVRTVMAMTPEKQVAANQKAAQLAGAWAAYKALPWQEAMPPALVEKMDEIAQDVAVLPTVRFKSEGATPAAPAAGKDKEKDKKPAAPSVEVVLSRIYDRMGVFRTAVAAAQAALPAN
jgi:hypothetical protein